MEQDGTGTEPDGQTPIPQVHWGAFESTKLQQSAAVQPLLPHRPKSQWHELGPRLSHPRIVQPQEASVVQQTMFSVPMVAGLHSLTGRTFDPVLSQTQPPNSSRSPAEHVWLDSSWEQLVDAHTHRPRLSSGSGI